MIFEVIAMALSLNTYDGEIIYDTNIDYYIDMYGFSSELVFSFKLPELYHHISDCYCVDTEPDEFEIECLKHCRKVIVAGTRNWISHKDSNGQSNINLAEFYTSMVIAIEIKKDELDSVISLFSKDADDLNVIATELLQNSLEVAFYRYNEKAGGKSFFTPSVKACDRVEMSLYKNYIEKRFKRCYYRLYEMELVRDTEEPIRVDSFMEKVDNWRYFYNKSLYELDNKRYIDSIVSAAISIEAFSWGIIQEKLKDEESIKEFASKEDGSKRFLSATGLYKKLIDEGMLKSSLSKSKIEDLIQKVLNPRNDIMHGKRSVVGSWKKEAENTRILIQQLFSSFGTDISSDIYFEKGCQNQKIAEYRNYVLKSTNAEDYPAEEMLELSIKATNDFPYMELPKINVIRMLFVLGRKEEATDKMLLLLSKTDNASSVALDIMISIIKLPYDMWDTIDIIKDMVDDKDERMMAMLGIFYIKRYKQTGCNDNSFLLMAAEYINSSIQINNKYILAHVLKCYISEVYESYEHYGVYRSLVSRIDYDVGFPMRGAEIAMKLDNVNDVIFFLDIFIIRFKEYHVSGIAMDFFTITYTLKEIVDRVQGILMYLKNKDVDTLWLEKFEIMFNESKDIPLNPKKVVLDNVSVFDVGKMPQKNIIIGNPMNIAGGYVVIK